MPAGWKHIAADDGDFCCDQTKCVNGHSSFLYQGGVGQAACVAKCAADKRCNFVTMSFDGNYDDYASQWCFNAQYCNKTNPYGYHKPSPASKAAVHTWSKPKGLPLQLAAAPQLKPKPMPDFDSEHNRGWQGADRPAQQQPQLQPGAAPALAGVRELGSLTSPWYTRSYPCQRPSIKQFSGADP